MSIPFPLDLKPRWRLPSDLGYGPDNPPDQFFLGDIWVSRESDAVGRYVVITEASPHVLVGAEFLDAVEVDATVHGRARNDTVGCRLEWPKLTDGGYTGCLLHIDGRNRHLVYRIGKFRPKSRTYEASWPD